MNTDKPSSDILLLTLEEVYKVARLARLSVSEEEANQLSTQLSSILGYVAELDHLDVADVPPTLHAVLSTDGPSETAGFREDVVKPGLPREEALAAAPASEEGGFAVPKVLETEDQ